MKNNFIPTIFAFLTLILVVGCTSNSNDPEFLKRVEGRYLYTADEVAKVYSKEKILLLEWRGAKAIKPSKIDDNTFFVKEMNAKIRFLKNPDDQKDYLIFVPKEKDSEIEYIHRKLTADEKTPSEYLANKEFEKALEGYLTIKEHDSLSPLLNFWNFDRKGRRYLEKDSLELALEVFKLNVALHPQESNAYVRLGKTYLESKDTVNALTNYKKGLKFNSGSRRLKERIEKLEEKQAKNTN